MRILIQRRVFLLHPIHRLGLRAAVSKVTKTKFPGLCQELKYYHRIIVILRPGFACSRSAGLLGRASKMSAVLTAFAGSQNVNGVTAHKASCALNMPRDFSTWYTFIHWTYNVCSPRNKLVTRHKNLSHSFFVTSNFIVIEWPMAVLFCQVPEDFLYIINLSTIFLTFLDVTNNTYSCKIMGHEVLIYFLRKKYTFRYLASISWPVCTVNIFICRQNIN